MRPSILMIAAVLAACGPSIRVDSMEGPGATIRTGQSYSWRSGSGGVHGSALTSENPVLDEMIRSVIDEELKSRGFRRTEGASDLGVAYVAAVERAMSIREVNYFLGYRRGADVVSRTEVDEFDVGSLILDVTDGESGDLLWRGSAEADLDSEDPADRLDKLREGVAELVGVLAEASGGEAGS